MKEIDQAYNEIMLQIESRKPYDQKPESQPTDQNNEEE